MVNQQTINDPQLDKDPLDAAMDAEYDPTRTYFGQINIDTHYCTFQKDPASGKFTKVIFDPGQHKMADRRVSVGIDIASLPGEKYSFFLQREFIAESREWATVVKPSLRAIGADLRTINSKWVQVQLVPTGRKYLNAAGEERDATTFKFIAVYQTEADCLAAAGAHFDRNYGTPPPPIDSPSPAADDPNNPERETARRFLEPLWKSCNGDAEKFYEQLRTNPFLSKYFDSGSREVFKLVFAKEEVPF